MFTVKEPFKGVSDDTVTIHTGADKSNCGVAFTPGEDYLIYAGADKEGNLHTGMCSRTRSLSYANRDLAYLRSYSGPPVTTRIKGNVQRAVGYTLKPRSSVFIKHRQLFNPEHYCPVNDSVTGGN